MGNAESECPAELEEPLRADLPALRQRHKQLAASAKAQGGWSAELLLAGGGGGAGDPVIAQGLVAALLDTKRRAVPFAAYCAAYFRLCKDLQASRRAAALAALYGDPVDPARVARHLWRALRAAAGPAAGDAPAEGEAQLAESLGAWLGACSFPAAPAASALAAFVDGSAHHLLVAAQLACAACLLPPAAPPSPTLLAPRLAEASDALQPLDTALLLLAMPHWVGVEQPAAAHAVKPRRHAADLHRMPAERPPWELLYSSQKHGRSIRNLDHHVVGYAGPSVLVVTAADGGVFGAYLPLAWEAAVDYRGTADCFLFTLAPRFRVLPATGSKANHLYFNPKFDAKDRDKGIGLGGRPGYFRLWLDAELSAGSTTDVCTTFAPGALGHGPGPFAVRAVEVWGCGTAESLQRLESYRRMLEGHIANQRKVDRRAFLGESNWQESPDMAILQLAGIAGHSANAGINPELEAACCPRPDPRDQPPQPPP